MAQARLNDQKAVSTYVYAPTENVGFILPKQGQFTFFVSGGMQPTFGMPSTELNDLIAKFANRFEVKVKDALERDETNGTKQLVAKVKGLANAVLELKEKAANKAIFVDAASIASTVIKTDHIPIMLSGIAPAEASKRAARTISPEDVAKYLDRTRSHDQAREYCVKQAMMQLISDLREEVIRERNHLSPGGTPYVASNRLILALDEEIIQANQRTLPAYEQFDLQETFVRVLEDLICGISRENQRLSQLIDKVLAEARSVTNGITFEVQKEISDKLYGCLQDFVKKGIGLDGSGGKLTVEQYQMLQAVLPLIAYLNSPRNPYARNGLFQDEALTNPEHTLALNAYQSHEKGIYSHVSYVQRFEYVYTPCEKVKFTDEQIDQLLYGSELEEKKTVVQGFFGAVALGMKALAIEGAACDPAVQVVEKGNQRRALLALPMPPQHVNTQLRITDGSENKNRPKK